MNPLTNDHFEAQFTALKDQINPHFLFNSLSVLSSLIRKDPDLSEQFIEHLAKVYRYLLEQKDNELVTLQTELSFLDSYAFLLTVRFGCKLSVDLPQPESMPPAAATWRLLPFTLQLLIENAIRHNRMSAVEPLRLTIDVWPDDLTPRLIVINNQQLRVTPDGETRQRGPTRRGLTSLCERYAVRMGKTISVGVDQDTFRVCVPLLTKASP